MNTLQTLGPDLFTLHHSSYSVGGLAIGTRTNVLRLGDGCLALHTPGPLAPDDLAAIRALGEVRWLLAPNAMHHLCLGAAAKEFPNAEILAVDGVRAKQKGLRIRGGFDEPLPPPLASVLEVGRIDGCPRLDERPLYIPAARTLLAVDLVFNLHGLRGLTRWAMMLNGAHDRTAVSRLGRSMYIADAASAFRSVEEMLKRWDVSTVAVAHGEVLAGGGGDAVAMAWAFAGPPSA